MAEFLTTREVADYLRLKERKVYDLARNHAIPCARITGKLLFPRQAIDLWVMSHLEGDSATSTPPPPVYAGSQDPLLEWALRESHADLGLLCQGSGDGVERLLDGRAQLAGLHVLDPASGAYNDPVRLGLGGMRDLVMIEWAEREQGLVVAPGNPLGLTAIADLQRPGVRIARRQHGAGAATLFHHLLETAGIDPRSLALAPRPALTEDDLALEVRDGRADCGLAVEAAARRHGLDFLPLARERFDLAMRRRSYFEAPMQRLMAFVQSTTFRERATALGGYDVSRCATVRYNA
ncbi:substrate-binding domain-containing protein [Arhodomonas sp. AD133]|uniref:substrate-binding domain-containing protein n=1 Tax=Arhodomonas sp. AD133 TaxID=3415009 RepID=UPI003EB6B6BD